MQTYNNWGVSPWQYAAAAFSAAFHNALSKGQNGIEAGIIAAANCYADQIKFHPTESVKLKAAQVAMLSIHDKKADQDEIGLLNIGKEAYLNA